jgi:hypothetical protein
MFVCLKYDLISELVSPFVSPCRISYARTLENSVEGCMTKLSLVLDQEIKC